MKNEIGDKRQAWRVVLLDDHPLVRDAYRALIEAEHDLTVVACLETSGALTATLRQMSVDVVLLDYRLADDEFDGVPLIQRLRARFPATRLLVCSASDDPATVAAVFLAGAQGFLSKAAPLEECAKAIRAVAAGLRYAAGEVSPRNLTHVTQLDDTRMPPILTAFSNAHTAKAAIAASATATGYAGYAGCAASAASDLRRTDLTHDGIVGSEPPLQRETYAEVLSDACPFSAVPSVSADVVLPGALSIKEFDVLRCAQQGLSPTSIAVKFKRSVKTVSGHKVAAYRKIAIERDAQLYLRRPRSRDQ